MPSTKPKLQGYVEPEVLLAFQQWQEEQGIGGLSEALNFALKQFLGLEKPVPAAGGLGKEEIEALIEEECEIRLREIKEDIVSRLPSIPEIIAKAEAQAQSWMDKNSEEWMHRLGEQFYKRIYTLERKVQAIDSWLSREEPGIYQPLEPEIEEESPLDSPQSPSVVEEREWQIGDRVRVLCPCKYQGMPGTIVDFQKSLGWHIAIDRWWKAVGVAESAIDERQKRTGNIWCEPSEIEPLEELPQEPEEEPPLSSLEQEDAEANPLPIPCQSPLPLEGLKQSELERRLKIAKGTLTKRRNRDDFKEWSREKDPDKIAWQWDAIAKKYLAVE